MHIELINRFWLVTLCSYVPLINTIISGILDIYSHVLGSVCDGLYSRSSRCSRKLRGLVSGEVRFTMSFCSIILITWPFDNLVDNSRKSAIFCLSCWKTTNIHESVTFQWYLDVPAIRALLVWLWMLRLLERDFSSKTSKIDWILLDPIDFGLCSYISVITGVPDVQAFACLTGDTPNYRNQ